MGWLDPELLRQFARVSSLGVQGVVILLIGVALGFGLDRLVPQLGSFGVLIGGLLGAAASAYFMIRVGRRLIEDGDGDHGDES